MRYKDIFNEQFALVLNVFSNSVGFVSSFPYISWETWFQTTDIGQSRGELYWHYLIEKYEIFETI